MISPQPGAAQPAIVTLRHGSAIIASKSELFCAAVLETDAVAVVTGCGWL
jgi:hypothetical protein